MNIQRYIEFIGALVQWTGISSFRAPIAHANKQVKNKKKCRIFEFPSGLLDAVTRERKRSNTNKIRYVKIKRQPIPILASLAQTEN